MNFCFQEDGIGLHFPILCYEHLKTLGRVGKITAESLERGKEAATLEAPRKQGAEFPGFWGVGLMSESGRCRSQQPGNTSGLKGRPSLLPNQRAGGQLQADGAGGAWELCLVLQPSSQRASTVLQLKMKVLISFQNWIPFPFDSGLGETNKRGSRKS